jgi:hypothetical protein
MCQALSSAGTGSKKRDWLRVFEVPVLLFRNHDACWLFESQGLELP